MDSDGSGYRSTVKYNDRIPGNVPFASSYRFPFGEQLRSLRKFPSICRLLTASFPTVVGDVSQSRWSVGHPARFDDSDAEATKEACIDLHVRCPHREDQKSNRKNYLPIGARVNPLDRSGATVAIDSA